jgi:C6 transcription factor Pro1
LEVFCTLFNPSNDGRSLQFSTPEELFMVSIMGCENHIVWALAEISILACWMGLQKKSGTLSIPKLVRWTMQIGNHIMPPCRSPTAYYDKLEQTHIITSQALHTSA